MASITSTLLFLLSSAILLGSIYSQSSTGRYCQVRTCCEGRDDECHAPYPTSAPTTLCYCDRFCNRTKADCCPDFWEYCLGVRPPPDALEANKEPTVELLCCHDGKDYAVGEVLRVNCNTCTCRPVLYEFATFVCEQNDCAIKPDVVDNINDGNYGWVAGNTTEFWGLSTKDIMHYRTGTMKPTPSVMRMNNIQADTAGMDFPEEFDARENWPGLIEAVQNQGNCASSWAMSTSATASDRLAIQSNGTMKMDLSPQHLLSCNVKRQQGCNGGHLDRAWWYMRTRGVVTQNCYPYTSGMSADMQMKKGTCYIRGHSNLPTHCPNPMEISERYQSTPPYRIARNEEQIKAEILKNGPVQAVYNVKSDFFMYKGGVYRHVPIQETAGDVQFTGDQTSIQGDEPQADEEGSWHSVRIIGWGVDRSYPNRPLKYWLCVNSWGTEWGEDGLFRVARGENECDIESFVVGVWGKVDSEMIKPVSSNDVI